MKKVILIVFVLAVILGILFWYYGTNLLDKPTPPQNQHITLNFWGLNEDERVYRPIIEAYQNSHPNTTVNFIAQNSLNYRSRLQAQIEAGKGPDIFKIHSSWIPMLRSDLYPAPDSIYTLDEYSQTFYPVAKDLLTSKKQVLATPMELDGLVLYYNEEILKAANVKLPTTWQEFIDAAKAVTVKDQEGRIQTAGAAMGSTSNVDFWPEIVGLLFLQEPRGDLVSIANSNGSEVIRFYTSFIVNPNNKVWDVTLPSSTQMFASGKLAFYFAPFSQSKVLLQANPSLHFKALPVPQLPGSKIAWGEFWAEGVSVKSENPLEAWDFLKYLSLSTVLQSIRNNQFQLGLTVYPYPRVDMAGQQLNDPLYNAFITQGGYYKGGFLNTGTEDGGVNGDMIALFKTIIDNTLQGKDVTVSLQEAAPEVGNILTRHNIAH